jgi:hypothetical protein
MIYQLHDNLLPATLRAHIQQFAETKAARVCSFPDGAYDNCYPVNTSFAQKVKRSGHAVRLFEMMGPPLYPNATRAWDNTFKNKCGTAIHCVAEIDGKYIVDWTLRQFNPHALFPFITDDINDFGWKQHCMKWDGVSPCMISTRPHRNKIQTAAVSDAATTRLPCSVCGKEMLLRTEYEAAAGIVRLFGCRFGCTEYKQIAPE